MTDKLSGELKSAHEAWMEAARQADDALVAELSVHPSAVAMSVKAQAFRAKVELRRAAYEDAKERAYEAARASDQQSARRLARTVAVFTGIVAFGTLGRLLVALAVALHLIGG